MCLLGIGLFIEIITFGKRLKKNIRNLNESIPAASQKKIAYIAR